MLEGEAGGEVGAAGCRALAPLDVSSLALRGLAVPPAAAMALAGSRAPVSIALSFFRDGRSDAQWISRIPTLTSLSAGTHPLSAASVEALRSHPALTALSVAAMPAEAVRRLAGSVRLASLSVIDEVDGDEARAFAALAGNATLTSLVIGNVTRADDIATLARSGTVSALTLHLHAAATASGFPALAAMPALRHLTLRGRGERIAVAAEDIAALCAKPPKSLNFSHTRMEPAAFAHVMSAHAHRLTWIDDRRLTEPEATALAANPRLSSLSLGTGMVNEAGALLLARARPAASGDELPECGSRGLQAACHGSLDGGGKSVGGPPCDRPCRRRG